MASHKNGNGNGGAENATVVVLRAILEESKKTRVEVGGLRGEVGGLRGEVRELRKDVDGIRIEVAGLRVEVRGIQQVLSGHGRQLLGIHSTLSERRKDGDRLTALEKRVGRLEVSRR